MLPGRRRAVADLLDAIARDADAVADDQRLVARDVRTMKRRLDRGWSWSKVLGDEQPARVLERARENSKQLARLLARLALVTAKGLSSEGESRRRVASRLGVTHQRVTAMLRNRSGSNA
jgi:hypothetical protein